MLKVYPDKCTVWCLTSIIGNKFSHRIKIIFALWVNIANLQYSRNYRVRFNSKTVKGIEVKWIPSQTGRANLDFDQCNTKWLVRYLRICKQLMLQGTFKIRENMTKIDLLNQLQNTCHFSWNIFHFSDTNFNCRLFHLKFTLKNKNRTENYSQE